MNNGVLNPAPLAASTGEAAIGHDRNPPSSRRQPDSFRQDALEGAAIVGAIERERPSIDTAWLALPVVRVKRGDFGRGRAGAVVVHASYIYFGDMPGLA